MFDINRYKESKLESHSFTSAKTERVCRSCSSSLLLLSALMASWMSSSEETTPHQILNIDSSTWESKSSSWKSTKSTSSPLLLLRILITSQIIHSFSFWIFQQLIRIDYLLKLFFSPRILFISIRMILLRSFFKSRFYLLFICISRDAQHLVWIWNFSQDGCEEVKQNKQQEGQFVHLTCDLDNNYKLIQFQIQQIHPGRAGRGRVKFMTNVRGCGSTRINIKQTFKCLLVYSLSTLTCCSVNVVIFAAEYIDYNLFILLMASKYRDRLLQSSGVSNIRVQSEYAKKVMAKMGWKEGNGLGKNEHGTTDCVQIKRREENAGLGKKTLGGPTNWKDEWWNDAYNNSIKKLQILPNKFKKKHQKAKQSSSSDDSSDDSSNSSSSSNMPSLFTYKSKSIIKAKKTK